MRRGCGCVDSRRRREGSSSCGIGGRLVLQCCRREHLLRVLPPQLGRAARPRRAVDAVAHLPAQVARLAAREARAVRAVHGAQVEEHSVEGLQGAGSAGGCCYGALRRVPPARRAGSSRTRTSTSSATAEEGAKRRAVQHKGWQQFEDAERAGPATEPRNSSNSLSRGVRGGGGGECR